LEECKRLVSDFILKRGLELNEAKTQITNIRNGIDFLGFNLRKMPKLIGTTGSELVLIIKPSTKGIMKIKDSLRSILRLSSMRSVIRKLEGDVSISVYPLALDLRSETWIFGFTNI